MDEKKTPEVTPGKKSFQEKLTGFFQKMSKKQLIAIIAAFVAVAILVPVIILLPKNNNTSKPGKNPTTPNNGQVAQPGDTNIVMPEVVDMDGFIYRAYVRDFAGEYEDQTLYGNNDYRCIDFWADAAGSEDDVIPYAVYGRNQQIENDYNCKIRQTSSNGDQLAFLVSALQNGDAYHLTIVEAERGAQAATQGLLRDLNATTYMDLSKPSFDQNGIKELSVKDKLYFVSGDMNISTMEVAGLSVVNMDFYEDLSDSIVNDLYGGNQLYSNIYNIVLAKKWTMETLLKIATQANIDVDKTDGALHALPHGYNKGEIVENKYNGGDTVGYHQYLYSTLWYFYGSGGRITQKNDEGLPEFIIDQDKGQTLYDYIFDKFNREVKTPWIPHESSAILNLNFLSGQVLFADCSLFNIRTEIYPKAQFEYGILPLPTYQEGMDYQSLVYFNNWAHLWAIPQMVGGDVDLEYAERMVEVMAVYSSLPNSTMDAYYERTIYMLAAKDNGSREVMDIIRTSLVYDIALLYDSWGNIEYKLSQIANEKESQLTEIVSSKVATEASIQATIDQLLNPSGE